MSLYRVPDTSERREESNDNGHDPFLLVVGLLMLLVGSYLLYCGFQPIEIGTGHEVGWIQFAIGLAMCVAGAWAFVGGIVSVFGHA
jgi:8-oxo-dGTP pyrophosphatase MutT (NUDIX family)